MSGDKGNKNRKYGRNKKWCEAYRVRGVREKNKRLRMERHLRNFPEDEQCRNAMRSIEDRRINALQNGR